jgi:DNA mismatch repair protein MutS
LQVARLAGVPQPVVGEARRYLQELERRDHTARPATPQRELDLPSPVDPAEAAALAELGALDPDGLSPRDALVALFKLKEILAGRR